MPASSLCEEELNTAQCTPPHFPDVMFGVATHCALCRRIARQCVSALLHGSVLRGGLGGKRKGCNDNMLSDSKFCHRHEGCGGAQQDDNSLVTHTQVNVLHTRR